MHIWISIIPNVWIGSTLCSMQTTFPFLLQEKFVLNNQTQPYVTEISTFLCQFWIQVQMMTSLWAVSAADALHWWEMYDVCNPHVLVHTTCTPCTVYLYTQQSWSCDCDLTGSGKRLMVDFTEEPVAFGIGGLNICWNEPWISNL